MTAAQLLALALTSSVVSGCAARQLCVKPVGDPALTPAVASRQTAETVVSWGGVVVASSSEDAAIVSEVTAYPLDRCGHPAVHKPTVGQFLVRHRHHVTPLAGQHLTATGRLLPTADAIPTLDEAVVRVWPDAPAAADVAHPILLWPFISIGIYGGGGRIGGGFGIHF